MYFYANDILVFSFGLENVRVQNLASSRILSWNIGNSSYQITAPNILMPSLSFHYSLKSIMWAYLIISTGLFPQLDHQRRVIEKSVKIQGVKPEFLGRNRDSRGRNRRDKYERRERDSREKPRGKDDCRNSQRPRSRTKEDDRVKSSSREDPRRNGADPKRNGADTKRNGADPKRNGADPKRNGADPKRNGADSKKNGADPKRNGADSKRNGADSKRSGTPPIHREAKRKSSGSEDVKRREEEVKKSGGREDSKLNAKEKL